ncbi:MAG: aminotransferase class III-fold pyridoxal phosphate-dependent enzyme, partial [Ruminococcus sp.]|nr:aminotransferase class III-fold pyridoxal phosphate-dependent enzyme [Ruminococcus sp.]
MIWYPYEQMKTMKPPYKITGAQGVYLYTPDNTMIDSVSSWWSMIHGYNHPEMNEAIKSQVNRFSHVMLGGLTHEPAERLAAKLEQWLPGDLDCCFFSDSGSVGVEVALKMALQYYVNRGDMKRTKLLALKHAYHGDTFKCMEAGDDEDYHFILEAYGEKRYAVHIPTDIPSLERAFDENGDSLYCMIAEPLLQGAGGMLMYDISFLRRARELCTQYGVLLIFDEVATGFGRTGNRFVSDIVLPD